MGVITSGSFAKALWPGVNAWWGEQYNEHKEQYPDLFTVEKVGERGWVEDVGVSGFGLAKVKNQGGSISYDEMRQSYITRYTHAVYGLGFVITRETYEDSMYDVVGKRDAKSLAFSVRQTMETVPANVYNRAFNSSYTGGDSKELCATDHPNFSGGTWANELTTAADLSEAALEQACIDIMKWTNDRGLKISVKPQSLIVPPDLVYEAERILKSPYRVGTGDNDINALYSMGKFPKGIKVNHYLTDADAWFIRTDVLNGMKFFLRRAVEFGVDNDFDTENAKYKATVRFSAGWTDPRGLYGSPGA